MSRAVSARMLGAMYKAATDETLLILVKVAHTSWPTPVYMVSDTEDVVSNGITYTAFPFDVQLPDEDPEAQQVETKMVISNVDRQISALLDALTSEPTVTVSFALKDAPDTLDYGPSDFTVGSYRYNKQQISGTLTHESTLDEPIPGDSINPQDYPGTFQ